MKKKNHLYYLFFLLFPCFLNSQSLNLTSCFDHQYGINDSSDSDGDGITCEAKITLTNTAYYTDGDGCDFSNIKWRIYVDFWGDGTDDYEYNSSLPAADNTFDDTNGNGIPDIHIPMTANNEMQSIELPDIEGALSIHKVRWIAMDDCGIIISCNVEFLVVDDKAPTPYCVSLATIIFSDYETAIFAEDFNIGSFDNCTDQEDIRYSFSPDSIVPMRKITCNDLLNSPVELKIYFWDDSDNIDFCSNYLTVIPGPSGVDCWPNAVVHGKVKNWKDEPIEGVEVKLEAALPEFPLVRYTDADGNYSFGVLPNGVDYTLSASFEDSYNTDVSTLDLVLIVRHILGIESFTNPYRIIASDVNGDYIVKVSDVLLLRKLLLGIISEISTNTVWKFMKADFEFEDSSDPFPSLGSSSEDLFQFDFNIINPVGYDFIGVKTGDVSE